MKEQWRPVVGWEGLYEVSDQGRVRSLDRICEPRTRAGGVAKRHVKGRILKQVAGSGARANKRWSGSGGYCAVSLASAKRNKKESRLVHRLVLEAFVGPDPGNMDGAHKDGNTLNNRLSNLRWATRKSNMADMSSQGRKIRALGLFSPFDLSTVRAVVIRRSRGETMQRIAAHVGVSVDTVRRMLFDKDYLLRNFGLTLSDSAIRAA